MMYCESCGEMFWEPDYRCWTEAHGEDWAAAICPYCESGEIEDAVRCDDCGEWFPEEEITDGLCSDCRKDLKYV